MAGYNRVRINAANVHAFFSSRGLDKGTTLSAPVPTIFDGIPVLNPQKSTFYWFGSGRSEHDIDNLWDVFSYALALDKNDNIDNRENFQKAFDASLSQKGVKWNLSMGLYWIRPNRFLNLDSRNREFIDNNDSLPESIVTTVKSLRNMPNAEMYLKLCDDCIRYINSDYSLYNSIAELSYNAWNTSKEDSPSWAETLIFDNEVEEVKRKGVAKGAGDIVSNAPDMVKWMEGLYGGKIVSPDTLREMTEDYSPDYGEKYGYGLTPMFAGGAGHEGAISDYSSIDYFKGKRNKDSDYQTDKT